MKIFKKILAWLIGGILGLVYFLATFFIDVGQCDVFHNCSGSTGLITMILNFPAVLISYIFGGIGGFYVIAVIDIIFGSIVGFLIGKFINFLRKRNK